MIVGVAVVELRVHASQSLKEKRGVVRRIAGRLANRFNASVAEVGGQDTWQRAVLGIAMAGSDETVVRRGLARAIAFVEDTHLAELLASDVEILRMPLAGSEETGRDEIDSEATGREAAGGEDIDWDLPWSGTAGRSEPDEREG